MNQLIISAIRQKRVLKLHYKGFDRLVEPHFYGADADGAPKLLCYQTAGGSSSKAQSDWKLFNVAEISALDLTDMHFANARHGYKLGDSSFEQIYAQVQTRGLADWRG